MSLEVGRRELGPIGTNTYLVRASPSADDAVIVDPSGDAATIQEWLSAVGARCTTILVTHGHFDHIVSLADLAERTGATVYAPEGERFLIEDPSSFAPPELAVRGARPDVWLKGGETVAAAGISFSVESVPGHSPAHLAYFAEGELFSGDVLFEGSVGRTDFPGSDWGTLMTSIAGLIDSYPRETVVHPGHGPETTLGEELERNPFLADLRAGRTA